MLKGPPVNILISSEPISIALSSKLSALKESKSFDKMINIEHDKRRNYILSTIDSRNPAAAHRALKTAKTATKPSIHTLSAGNINYFGDDVPDGFYQSLLNLKDPDSLPTNPEH